jgi:hypothetical protein
MVLLRSRAPRYLYRRAWLRLSACPGDDGLPVDGALLGVERAGGLRSLRRPLLGASGAIPRFARQNNSAPFGAHLLGPFGPPLPRVARSPPRVQGPAPPRAARALDPGPLLPALSRAYRAGELPGPPAGGAVVVPYSSQESPCRTVDVSGALSVRRCARAAVSRWCSSARCSTSFRRADPTQSGARRSGVAVPRRNRRGRRIVHHSRAIPILRRSPITGRSSEVRGRRKGAFSLVPSTVLGMVGSGGEPDCS